MFELRLLCPEQRVEPVSDALDALDALSVSVEDADAQTAEEEALFGEPGLPPPKEGWQRSRVLALFANEEVASDAGRILQAQDFFEGCRVLGVAPVPDQDWVRLTQSQFEPIHIGKNIWVVPSWHDAPDPNALVLELDPGLAFGTGSHPTTRLCMEWLEAHAPRGLSVLDYGCGSGILAMVAAKLHAAEVVGVDIDPQAIESARFNAERNQCDIAFYLPELFGEADHRSRYDVVVANILSSPLKLMAPMLSGRVAPGGRLVLSGVLARQADEVIAAYAPHLPLSVWAEREGWVALAGQAPQAASTL
jgi:ribosomal protein L11 methyltransferase